MAQEDDKEFRSINKILGTQASLGPIPAELVFPFALIALLSYFICRGIFALSWLWTVLCAGWLGGTWWILTNTRNWRYLSKFIGVPKWTRGMARYQSLLHRGSNESKNQNTKRKHRRPKR
ncbi:MAG: hypothetical protein F6K41_43385 [Symploca sp. SIO3E6]|nr:hypothetical protein [Caldora sp. SIO3E6]